jgi:glycosyltransferase involved in cell wall biosynthesis
LTGATDNFQANLDNIKQEHEAASAFRFAPVSMMSIKNVSSLSFTRVSNGLAHRKSWSLFYVTQIRPQAARASSPIRQLWRGAPPPLRHGVNQVLTYGLQCVGQVRGSLERGGQPSAPICVMGLHRAVLGIGRGARLFQTTLSSIGVPTTAWDVSEVLGDDLTLPPPPSDFSSATTVVTHLNPIEHLHALARYTGPRPKRGYRVGYWAWETSQVPDPWLAGVAAVDEIWCPSTFTAHSIRRLLGSRRPIRVIPHPIVPGLVGQADKAKFGLPTDKVIFFTACDLRSSINRKNPLGAIEAFQRSGCGARGEAILLIKVHGDFAGSGLPALQQAAERTPGVQIMDVKLSAYEMRALRSSIDVVLSPHRSEGFGLVLAEAMQAGKPVIATGWSGNMDFMDRNSAALISSKEVPVVDPSGIYQTGTWAEPDLDHAALLIERLAGSAEERKRLGDAGATKIAAYSNLHEWQNRVCKHLGIETPPRH